MITLNKIKLIIFTYILSLTYNITFLLICKSIRSTIINILEYEKYIFLTHYFEYTFF